MWIAGNRTAIVYAGLSALAGVFGGLNLPGWKAFVSDLVPRERLLNAITLSSLQFNASRMFGPALAGITLAAAGPAWAFFINFVSFGAVLLALWRIDVRTGPTGGDREPFAPIRDFVETIGWIRGHEGIKQAIITVGLVGLLGMPIQVLAVVFAEDVFDSDATAYGLMLTMIGLGAVLTAPFVAGRGATMKRSRLESAALIVYAIGLISFAIAPSLLVAFGALLLVGSAHLTSASVLNTTVQVQVPEERRAKVLSVHMMVVTLSSPVGQLVLGQIMSRVAPRATMLAAGLVLATVAGLFLVMRRLDSLDAES
jgi:MFS family permease